MQNTSSYLEGYIEHSLVSAETHWQKAWGLGITVLLKRKNPIRLCWSHISECLSAYACVYVSVCERETETESDSVCICSLKLRLCSKINDLLKSAPPQ